MSAALATASPAPEPEEEVEKTTYDFDAAFQKKIAALAVRDTTFARKTEGLVLPDYFENEADAILIKIVNEYNATYRKSPDISILTMLIRDQIAAKKIRKDMIGPIRDRLKEILKTDVSDREFVVEKVAEFAQHQAMEKAIVASIPLLEKRDFSAIKKVMDQAQLVGVKDGDDDYDYFKEIESRTAHRVALVTGTIRPDGISTGYAEIDDVLEHKGWGRKELSIMMGAAKAGKSMSLGDFAKNATLLGYNVLYASCEVRKEIIASRIDANISLTAMKALKTSSMDVKKKVQAAEARAGILKIRDFPSGTLKVSQFRRIIEFYRAQGIIFDLLISDYGDIMAPEKRSDDPIEDSKRIFVDLRALAFEQNAAMLTATQTNREGAKAMTAKATDVAEDYNKIRTADLVISINATDAEKASGEARLFFAASRNSESEFQLHIRQDREKMKFITKVLGRI